MESQFLIYQNQEGNIKIDVRFQDETIWLSQAEMSVLFSKDKRTISEHISNIFKEGELDKNSVIRNSRTTATDGMAIEKSAQEYEKYQTKQRQIERVNSLKELEDDLKQLTN